MSKSHKSERWNLNRAAQEFDINQRTLSKRFKTCGIESGADGKWSTKEVCAAVFGDIDGERLRLVRAQADEKEISNAEQRGELVRFKDLLELAHRGLAAMTATVMGMTHLTIEDRESIINQLRAAGEIVESSNGSSDSSPALHGEPVG